MNILVHRKGSTVMSIERPEAARRVLQMIFKAILGGGGVAAFQYHLKRLLGRDPLEVFYEKPREFYKALEEFFGESGARVTFRVLYEKLIALSSFEELTPEKLFELLMRDEEAAREIIVKMLEEILRRGWEGVT